MSNTDREYFAFKDGTENWQAEWIEPTSVIPSETNHGASGICFDGDGRIIVVSSNHGNTWDLPGGRPEENESLEETFIREIKEECCAEVTDCSLLGYVRSECCSGERKGLILARSLFAAKVKIQKWIPLFETTDRKFLNPDCVMKEIKYSEGLKPLYLRWLRDAQIVMKV